jgi:diguanylate cyclase (GGDEF)-like protein
MGGDEFVLLVMHADAVHLDEKINAMRRVVVDAGGTTPEPCPLSLSVGIAIYPDDGADAEQLLAEADRRMYKSKITNRRAGASVAVLDEAIIEVEPAEAEPVAAVS